jgi:hypothetical protein
MDIFLDSDGISLACKIPKKQIQKYVREFGLPAFQENPPTGPYKARPESLERWAIKHEARFLPKK